ncbi:MAG: glycosyltransferase family 2 protein [Wenzhouxiangella sp.]|nr:MAG: glycosyltransferase family 2 protein [Wenzhouxiangella sp.]
MTKIPRSTPPQASLIMLSFNTRELLRRSLAQLIDAAKGIDAEIIVVDNASHDGSAAMIETEFPQVRLVKAPQNLGFAGGNNLGARHAHGDYLVLVNSDAFVEAGTLATGLARMRQQPQVGLAGGLLIGKDGQPEPSARRFPSPLNDLLSITGLAARFPGSRLFGRFDRTWADPQQAAEVDWVPGAFCIIRREAIKENGLFDERYFLYYEEVDLCRQLRKTGWTIAYWPDLKAVHWGGESSKTVSGANVSSHGRQLTLWRMRSGLLYYRHQHGLLYAWLARTIERTWHRLRQLRNRRHADKRAESAQIIALLDRAWQDTRAGRVSPPRPW